MRKVILPPQAEEDLNGIYEPVYSKLRHKMEMLRDFPQLGQALEEEFIGYRGLWVAPFRILYRIVAEERIDIVGIFHVRRKLVNPPE